MYCNVIYNYLKTVVVVYKLLLNCIILSFQVHCNLILAHHNGNDMVTGSCGTIRNQIVKPVPREGKSSCKIKTILCCS